jgi:hypothetical protein
MTRFEKAAAAAAAAASFTRAIDMFEIKRSQSP